MKKIFAFLGVVLAVLLVFGIGFAVGSDVFPETIHTIFSGTDDVPAADPPENRQTENIGQTTGDAPKNPEESSDRQTVGQEDPAPVSQTLIKKDDGLTRFSGDDELLSFVKEHFYENDRRYLYYGGMTKGMDMDDAIVYEAEALPEMALAAVPTEAAPAFDGDVSSTNVQTEGIDEGDIVKTDGKYIYILRGNELIIVEAGDEMKILSYYKLYASGDGSANQLYIKGDKAVIVGSLWKNEKVTVEESTDTSFGTPVDLLTAAVETVGNFIGDLTGDNKNVHEITVTKIYSAVMTIDISDREKPVEASTVLIEGDLLSSRETNGRIYLVSNKYFNRFYGTMPTLDDILPVYSVNGVSERVLSTEIVKPTDIENYNSNVMTIAAVDYENGGLADSMTVIGCGSDIYMTAESLYVFGSRWYDNQYTTVAKYSVGDTIGYVASVSVPGYASTDFSYNEYNGKFRIATTSYDGSGMTVNNVYVYDENLNRLGELTGLAKDESIKSVRFMENIAYVVTFRQVDPLFVIDLSEDTPKVLGELKVPGFSTYLHPVGDDLLLGIGYETRDNVYTDYYGKTYTSTYTCGMKVSLFDVSDPLDPKELDVANMVGGEGAYSAAQDNYKAFTWSDRTKTGYFAFDPAGYYNGYEYIYGSGFAAVSVADGKLDVKTVFPSEPNQYCSYDLRVIFIENNVFFYQYNRITVFDRQTLAETGSIVIK